MPETQNDIKVITEGVKVRHRGLLWDVVGDNLKDLENHGTESNHYLYIGTEEELESLDLCGSSYNHFTNTFSNFFKDIKVHINPVTGEVKNTWISDKEIVDCISKSPLFKLKEIDFEFKYYIYNRNIDVGKWVAANKLELY